MLLLPPPTPCNHIDNFIFRYSIIFKTFRIIFIVYINIIYKSIFIFQQSFQNIIALAYVWLFTKYTVSSKDVLFHLIYYNTYLLTPWSRVLLEKLTALQLVKKFPAFYGTRRFIIALTSARHLSLTWASSNQSTHPHPTSRRSILILSSYLDFLQYFWICCSKLCSPS